MLEKKKNFSANQTGIIQEHDFKLLINIHDSIYIFKMLQALFTVQHLSPNLFCTSKRFQPEPKKSQLAAEKAKKKKKKITDAETLSSFRLQN